MAEHHGLRIIEEAFCQLGHRPVRIKDIRGYQWGEDIAWGLNDPSGVLCQACGEFWPSGSCYRTGGLDYSVPDGEHKPCPGQKEETEK